MIAKLFRSRRRVKRLGGDQRGGALVEFALVFPFLLILTFGGYEFSRIVYVQSLITKSVQDAARYAARHPSVIETGSCVPSSAAWSAVQANAELIVRRGNLKETAPLHADLSSATVDVDVVCVAPTGTMVTSNPGAGTNVPIVVASVTLNVTDIGFFGFLRGMGIIGQDGIQLSAEHREFAVGL